MCFIPKRHKDYDFKKTYYGYSFENHNITMICFYFLLKKAYHDYILRI